MKLEDAADVPKVAPGRSPQEERGLKHDPHCAVLQLVVAPRKGSVG